jgi:hypothetical protein
VTGEQPDTPGVPRPPGVPQTPAIPERTPTLGSSDPAATNPLVTPVGDLGEKSSPYEKRFLAVYAVLGLVVVAAIGAFVVFAVQPGHKAAAPWSTWEPTPGTVAKMTSQIADHVSRSYRSSEGGPQLVAVVPSKPTVTSGTTNIAIKAIAIRKAANTNTGIEVLGSNKTYMYTFCGLGAGCSIAGGHATALRGRLVRREALEIALNTFKFVPSIDTVIAFMPPPPGSTDSPLVLLRKQDLTDALNKPLRTTLQRATPPLPTQNNQGEAKTIDELTLPAFTYQMQSLQTGGAAIVLDPAT